ncbi:rod shape-determining protein RodA [Candidatus Kuenenbacteria bacterium]|nr:rod shape-determining protein RodA [Candidatus Kuenenbacteria bacterium]
MLKNAIENIRKFDWVLCIAVVLLFCLGLAAIYSVSLNLPGENFNNFNKQVVFGVIGAVFLLIFGLSNYSGLWVYSRVIFVAMVVFLILVLFFGSVVRGTKGWFLIGGLGIQPVELAKIVLIILLAKFFSNRFQQFHISKHIIVSLFMTLSLVFFVMLQPDLGSSIILLGIWFILLMLTGINKKYIVFLLVIFLIIATIGWSFFLKDYQKERIMVFANPQSDPLGSGYNVSQSIIAIGSGKFLGRGLGFGSQSQLKFIPETQTDFIFAVIAEELGLIGVALVLGLWSVIFYRLILIAKKARDDFGLFLVLGIIALLFLHLFINIGMNIGVMPVMGISLPFLSYGGSFLIVCAILIGIAESVAVRK